MCVQCSASCGRGRRYRAVQCKYGDNNVLKSYCDSADEPESSIVCSSGPCPIWKTGIWGLVVIVSDIYFVSARAAICCIRFAFRRKTAKETTQFCSDKILTNKTLGGGI